MRCPPPAVSGARTLAATHTDPSEVTMSDTEVETQDEPAEAIGGDLPSDEPDAGDSPPEPAGAPETPAGDDAEPAAPQPQTEHELEEQRGKLQRSAANWRRRVGEVLGDDALHLLSCPLCEQDIPGFMFPPELVTPWDETHGRLLEVLRDTEQPFLNDAVDVSRCENCQGYGKVRTGSRVPGQETKACAQCNGFGYQPPPGLTDNGAGAGERVPVPAFAGGDGPVIEDADVWGSPRLMPDGQQNPNYGKMPQYKDATLP